MVDTALYLGRVRHRRMGGPEHRFSYPVWYLLVDLDELGELDRGLRCFGHNSFNLAGIDDRDHMGRARRPIRQKLTEWLRSRGVSGEIGRVRLLTQPRILGQAFNPVSFYFVDDLDDRMRYVVAEVNNTFGETFAYLLDATGDVVRQDRSKRFHVSPFQPVDGDYRFRIAKPGKRLGIHIEIVRGGDRVFDSTLSLARRELDATTLLKTVARRPYIGLWTLGLIHLQALRLWIKRAPFFSKPEPPPGAWRTRHGGP